MTIKHISIVNHIEVGSSGMPAQVPYVHVNGVKLCSLEPYEVETVVRVLRRATNSANQLGMANVVFQAAPGL